MKRRHRAKGGGVPSNRDEGKGADPSDADARPSAAEAADDESPGLPGFRRWREVYLLVFVVFVLVVTALAVFSGVFA